MHDDNCGMQAWFSTYLPPLFCGDVFLSSFHFIPSSVCTVNGADYFIVGFSVYVKNKSAVLHDNVTYQESEFLLCSEIFAPRFRGISVG